METEAQLNPQLETFCDSCQELDFDRIFSTKRIADDGIEIVKLGTKTLNGKESTCPLCRFFFELSPAYRRNYSLHVRLFSSVKAPQQQTNSTSPPHERFLSVLRSNSRLRYDSAIKEEIGQTGLISYISNEHPESCSIRLVSHNNIGYQFIRDQLSACSTDHANCSETKTRPSNLTYLKLIDCVDGKLVRGSLSDQYMTLSYVWGQQSSTSAESTSSKFCLENSPLTVRDAVQVVLNLGRRYLWVDRYCIDQEDSLERHSMIHSMDTIYENSEATIVALHGDNDESGLPGVSTTPRSSQLRMQTEKGILISSCPPITTLVAESKWNTRGWTYQEARLSRRCLFFSKFQVYFVCRHSTKSEAIPFDSSTSSVTKLVNDSRGNADLFGRNSSISNGYYYDRLEYTKRDLTKPEDILDAFWGITHRSAFLTVGGIPVRLDVSNLDLNTGFALGLLWLKRPHWTTSGHLVNPGSILSRRRPGFPTWSWTSLIAEIYQDNYGLKSAYGKLINEIPSQFPQNETHLVFAPLIDGKATPLTVKFIQMTASIKLRNVKEVSVDGEFISLRFRHREPFHEWYFVGDKWIYFEPDVWDADRDKNWPGQPTEQDEEAEAEAFVLIQWSESQKPSKTRLLLMLVKWIDQNRAERRGLLTNYRDEFPRKMVER